MKSPSVGRWFAVAAVLPVAIFVMGCAVVHNPAAFDWVKQVSITLARTVSASPAAGTNAPMAARAAPALSPVDQFESAELLAFSRRVANGKPGSVTGLYVAGVLALRVVQQPADDPSYISTEVGTATEFRRASQFGAVGLLAHNTLDGRDFLRLSPAQEIVVIYGDGRAEHFRVSQIVDYQRLTRADLRSDFLALDTSSRYSADEVFARFYQQAHRLTLQTCLSRGDVADWGVHFVVADPTRPQR